MHYGRSSEKAEVIYVDPITGKVDVWIHGSEHPITGLTSNDGRSPMAGDTITIVRLGGDRNMIEISGGSGYC
jgi:hypothetical protein